MSSPSIPYKKGDFIGQKYQVYGVLGHGGFGVVYLAYSHDMHSKGVYALKTFRDEYLRDTETRQMFHKEADIWVDLERHPYLVRAYFLDEVAGRLYVAMEYIAPNKQGLNSLEDYLERRPPDLAQGLRWAIQFCHGMEYAYSKGVRCHRDIKPANIMISTDKTVKISDFGLAGILNLSKMESKLNVEEGKVGLSILEGRGFGTPTHMPPEQFTNAASCDERSDIYAFGIVLYQMATGGTLPFLAPLPRDDSEEEMRRFCKAMYRLHSEAPVPKVASPLFTVIQRCLEKEQGMRYQTFKQLRADLEPLLKNQTGETVKLPEPKEIEAWELSNKGASLNILGRFADAIECSDRAAKINPQLAQAWNNKGNSLHSLGRFVDAIRCFDKAIEIDPSDGCVWSNEGKSFAGLGRFVEAITCYDKAVKINPLLAGAWTNKGASLDHLGRFV
ncbi:serine/threonine-protein kinase [Candidatus Bathyarchaeota archaeon]|nr:serine/threonine-protein kinase [Candidatus Bathyarchaeota archaeon]